MSPELALHGVGYCIECGERLETGHRYCPRCGTERWSPAPPPTAPAGPVPAPPGLSWLPWIYAAGAVYWLITCARAAAYLAAPGGVQAFVRESGVGFPGLRDPAVVGPALGVSLGLYALAAGLHGVAYFGLRRRALWGWTVAVLVAALWSLLLIGIPILYVLLRRSTRRAFGVG